MNDFEKLLEKEKSTVRRFVFYRLQNRADAEDVLQEIFLSAYTKFSLLKKESSFKAWILEIARNKCNDYYRKKALQNEVSFDEVTDKLLLDGKWGVGDDFFVREIMNKLCEQDRFILYLYYWQDLPYNKISNKLNIPVGTVKSRIYNAKKNFKNKYSLTEYDNGEKEKMKQFPKILYNYKINKNEDKTFSVKWEELSGWFIVPKLKEKLSWAMYDMPSRKRGCVYDMKVTGNAEIHGVKGVEVVVNEALRSCKSNILYSSFIVQLTKDYCRYLAAFRDDGDVKKCLTFLDGKDFTSIWGLGEENCGRETNIFEKGEIVRKGNNVTCLNKSYLVDIVGRYNILLNAKSYDTVCVMDIECRGCDVITEQFLDQNGKTILWRRYNRDDWAKNIYGKTWSEMLPENETLIVDNILYVHWYDCITDYIL